MPWLERVDFDRTKANLDSWPWTIGALAGVASIAFDAPVTFLVGENGTGKSTVLEAVALACGCPAEGGAANRWLKGPTWGDSLAVRTRPRLTAAPVGGAFFLRAETFFNLATAAERAATDQTGFDDAQLLAAFGWQSPHELSHGQAFVGLFQGRMHASSLWFMDEPEAALSFQSQLVLLAELHQLAQRGDTQFVIATHSPVLTACPGAAIYEFGATSLERTTWDELALVAHTRTFLEAPQAYLRHLLDADE